MCTFNFLPGEVNWDSGFFGQFFDMIRDEGFTQREEKKGVKFEITPQIPAAVPTMQELDSQMIFRDPERKFAITMGKQLLSFHIVSTYADWESFNNELIIPYMGKYIGLGIYEKILSCQVLYLNSFRFDGKDSLSDYFKIVTPPMSQIGTEVFVNVNKSYLTPKGITLSVRVIPQPAAVPGTNQIMMECGAIGMVNNGLPIADWRSISGSVRQPIREFFEAIITPKLRETL
jgi:uncharacterized protein (TIGR04255 family)